VGNARHAAHFWASAFGFRIVGYAGPETGLADRQTYVVRQGEITFVLTSPLDGDGEIARHVLAHGDGVKDVAYRVLEGGGRTIEAYGDTVHSLVEGPLGGFEPLDLPIEVGEPVGLTAYDHVVANVEQGRLDEWVDWYRDVFGFQVLQSFTEDDISTEFSALRSTVVWNGDKVVQPINEPAPGRKKSQIEEYLDYYGTPGVQHLALRTDDIVATVAELRRRGVRFMRVPGSYYDEAPDRLAGLGADLPWERLAELGILVDRDQGGYLLQIFTEPVASRPTAFVEIIQRHGARGFGEGNFQALFTSIEAEQARRGNL
jgi:4-hydroxyphenylpyruvate dioxygenase